MVATDEFGNAAIPLPAYGSEKFVYVGDVPEELAAAADEQNAGEGAEQPVTDDNGVTFEPETGDDEVDYQDYLEVGDASGESEEPQVLMQAGAAHIIGQSTESTGYSIVTTDAEGNTQIILPPDGTEKIVYVVNVPQQVYEYAESGASNSTDSGNGQETEASGEGQDGSGEEEDRGRDKKGFQGDATPASKSTNKFASARLA